MESTKQIRSIRSIRGQKKQTYSLPFREGPGVGFPPNQASTARAANLHETHGVG